MTKCKCKEFRMRILDCLERIRNAKESMDVENAHKEADKALLECIGEKDITEAFESMERWYA